ncbi:hypothetical protein PAL_GLEAN10023239 [Pteropus alecto]|uniref:Uncharacterized protein n=1 Tax=Pteropus alecto TaxID=9402 RepID=L5K410_PTEAL|nr:hypothetical protein PAL_GLEAN10023239 [Pteropus alecto]
MSAFGKQEENDKKASEGSEEGVAETNRQASLPAAIKFKLLSLEFKALYSEITTQIFGWALAFPLHAPRVLQPNYPGSADIRSNPEHSPPQPNFLAWSQ